MASYSLDNFLVEVLEHGVLPICLRNMKMKRTPVIDPIHRTCRYYFVVLMAISQEQVRTTLGAKWSYENRPTVGVGVVVMPYGLFSFQDDNLLNLKNPLKLQLE